MIKEEPQPIFWLHGITSQKKYLSAWKILWPHSFQRITPSCSICQESAVDSEKPCRRVGAFSASATIDACITRPIFTYNKNNIHCMFHHLVISSLSPLSSFFSPLSFLSFLFLSSLSPFFPSLSGLWSLWPCGANLKKPFQRSTVANLGSPTESTEIRRYKPDTHGNFHGRGP